MVGARAHRWAIITLVAGLAAIGLSFAVFEPRSAEQVILGLLGAVLLVLAGGLYVVGGAPEKKE